MNKKFSYFIIIIFQIMASYFYGQKSVLIPDDTVKIMGFIKNFPSVNDAYIVNDYIFQSIRNETNDNYIAIYKTNLTIDTLDYISTKTFLRLHPNENPTTTNASGVDDFFLLNDSIVFARGYVYLPYYNDIYTVLRKYNIYGDQYPVEEYIAKNISFVPLLSDESKIYGSYIAFYGDTAPDALNTGWPIFYHDNRWDRSFVAFDKDLNFLWSYYPPDSYTDINYDVTSTWSLINLTKLTNGHLMLGTRISIINENGDKQFKTRYIELNPENGEFVRTIWETDLREDYHIFVQDPYTGDFYAQYPETLADLDIEHPVIVKYDFNMHQVAKTHPLYWGYGFGFGNFNFTPDFVVIRGYYQLNYLSKTDLTFNKRYPIDRPIVDYYSRENLSYNNVNEENIKTFFSVFKDSSLDNKNQSNEQLIQRNSNTFLVRNSASITPPYDHSGNLQYYIGATYTSSLVVSDTYNSYCNLNAITNFIENRFYRWVVRFKDDSSLKSYINLENTPAISAYDYMRRLPGTDSLVPTKDHISWMQMPQDYNFSELDTVNINALDLTGTRIPKSWFNIPSTMNYMDAFVEIDTEGRYRIVLITTETENESTNFPYVNIKDHMHFLYIYLTTDNLLGVEDFSSNDIYIYPNPTESFLNINSDDKMKLMIYDMSGKIIRIYDINEGNTRINVNFLSRGVYNFKFINNKYTFSKKIILK